MQGARRCLAEVRLASPWAAEIALLCLVLFGAVGNQDPRPMNDPSRFSDERTKNHVSDGEVVNIEWPDSLITSTNAVEGRRRGLHVDEFLAASRAATRSSQLPSRRVLMERERRKRRIGGGGGCRPDVPRYGTYGTRVPTSCIVILRTRHLHYTHYVTPPSCIYANLSTRQLTIAAGKSIVSKSPRDMLSQVHEGGHQPSSMKPVNVAWAA